MNSVWSLLWNGTFVPDRVVLLTHARHKVVAQRAASTLKTLLAAYGVPSEPRILIVPESDLKASHLAIHTEIRRVKAEGQVALNITPARKSLAAVAMVAAWDVGVDRIDYLYLKEMRAAERPYPLIARALHELVDLRSLRGT